MSFDTDTGVSTYSHEPSPEGGWPSFYKNTGSLLDSELTEKGSVLGLRNPSADIDIFKDEQGKMKALVRYTDVGAFQQGPGGKDGKIDLKKVDQNDYTIVGSALYVAADLDAQWIHSTPVLSLVEHPSANWDYLDDNPKYPPRRLGAILKISAPVVLKSPAPDANMVIDASRAIGPLQLPTEFAVNDGSSAEWKYNTDLTVVPSHPGGLEKTVNAIAPQACWPNAAGVPIKSNLSTYGPWHAKLIDSSIDNKQVTLPGGVQFDVDEGLVPWEYGSIYAMNSAGISKVVDNTTQVQWAERGEVVVPGYPTISVGSSLLMASDDFNEKTDGSPSVWKQQALYDTRESEKKDNGYNKAGDIDYVIVDFENIKDDKYINAKLLSKLQSCSVSNINVSVGPNGVTTSYQISTFTPVYGRFSKGNADRIKQIGLNRLKNEREMRARDALRRLLLSSGSRAGGAGKGLLGGGGGTGGGVNLATASAIGQGSIAPKSSAGLMIGKYNQTVPDRDDRYTWYDATNPAANPFADRRRKIVLNADSTTLTNYEDYEHTAMMTMDGLFRPVAKYGSSQTMFTSLLCPNLSPKNDPHGGGLPRNAWTNEKRTQNIQSKPEMGWYSKTNARKTNTSAPPPPMTYQSDPARTLLRGNGTLPEDMTPEDYEELRGNIPNELLAITTEYLDFLTDPISNPALAYDARATGIFSLESYQDPQFGKQQAWYDTSPLQAEGEIGYRLSMGHDIEGVARSGSKEIIEDPVLSGSILFGHPDSYPSLPGLNTNTQENWGFKSEMWPEDRKFSDTAGRNPRCYAENYRYMALRGPLVIHGWGYDVYGKPIPNECDQPSFYKKPYVSSDLCFDVGPGGYTFQGAKHGEFQTDYSSATNNFYPNWLQDPDSWPVAPVDLRYDRKRGVWTVPPAYRMYTVSVGGQDPNPPDPESPETTIKLIAPDSSAKCTVIAFKDDISNKYPGGREYTIEVYNPYEYSIPIPVNNTSFPAASTMAYYDTAAGQYWALPPYKPGFPVYGVTNCNSKDGGSPALVGRPGEWATGCPEAKGGTDHPYETPLIFKCGLQAVGYEGTDEEDQGDCRAITIEGLRVSSKFGEVPVPELGCAKSIDFGVGMKLIPLEVPNEETTGCSWRVEAIGGGGVGGDEIEVVTDIVCVGSAFNVTKKTILAGANCPVGYIWNTLTQECEVI